MEKIIKTDEVTKFKNIYCVRTIVAITYFTISPFIWRGFLGEAAIYINYIVAIVMLYYIHKFAKLKKSHDLSTYKEILAFTNGTMLDEDEKNSELKKRKYQVVLYIIILVALVVIYSRVFNCFF